MIENPEAAHAHHGAGIKWFDIAMGLSILLVSVASVVISIHTGSTMEQLVHENARLVRANSTPILGFRTGNAGNNDERRITFSVTNSGTGPARIVWFEISKNGKPYLGILPLVRALGFPSLPLVHSGTVQVAQTLLRAGNDQTILSWARPTGGPEMAAWDAMEQARFKLDVETCYCSLLDECFQGKLDGSVPRSVKVCSPAGHKSFNDYAALEAELGKPQGGK